ncbi:hypothetical protein [Mammaliicoccus sp. E-M24]|uniref:hypothetical protein n=1 Tax=Mammaliicoccus sp. E-M24 TaxID=2898684 RepID=UPI001EFBA7B8
MARKVKCPYCNQSGEKENMIHQSTTKRYWHKECLEENEKKRLAGMTDKDRDKEERKKLIEYICKLFDIDAPTGFILKQIKEYHTEYNYRYYAIQLALEYFFVVKQNDTGKSKGIGIVPYIMEDAKEFYMNLARLKNEKYIEAETKTVKVKTNKNRTNNRKKKLIDMEDI